MAPNKNSPQALETLKKFRIIFSSVKTQFSQIQKSCGITGAQLWTLQETVRDPGLTVGDLAHALSVKPTTASNLVEKLVSSGHLRRERCRTDQRKVQLFPTDLALETLRKAPGPPSGILPVALDRLSAEELQDLDRLLARLLLEFDFKDDARMLSDL